MGALELCRVVAWGGGTQPGGSRAPPSFGGHRGATHTRERHSRQISIVPVARAPNGATLCQAAPAPARLAARP